MRSVIALYLARKVEAVVRHIPIHPDLRLPLIALHCDRAYTDIEYTHSRVLYRAAGVAVIASCNPPSSLRAPIVFEGVPPAMETLDADR